MTYRGAIAWCHCTHKASWYHRKVGLVQPASECADAEGITEEDLSASWWGDLGFHV